MPLSRGDWYNIALCLGIVGVLILAFNLKPARPSKSSPTNVITFAETEKFQTKTFGKLDTSFATTTITSTAPTILVERKVVNRARHRPRMVELCVEARVDGKCEKRWVVSA
jgi:hypothetical protein